MPIYEYECAACGQRQEILQKVGEALLRDCPDCGKPELVKLVSAAGFRLAGSGWYETDFKTGSKRNLAASGDAEGGSSKGKQGKQDKQDKQDKQGKSGDGKKSAAAPAKPAADKGSA